MKIDTNIPIPPKFPYSNQRILRQALKEMKYGDSFIVDYCQKAHHAAKCAGVKILTRKVNGEGFRVWKIK